MATAPLPRTSYAPRLGVLGAVVRRAFGESAVGIQVVLGTALVLAAAERRSVLSAPNHGAFTSWFAGPLEGLLPSLTGNATVLHRDLRIAIAAMVGAWLVVVLAGRAVRPRLVIGAVVVLHAVFLLCPPLALTDLFNYIGYARLDVVHHLNPYVDLPLLRPADPVYAYSNWHQLRSPYGPLFTLLMLPIAKLPLPAAYWTYKVVATAASLGLLAAVWACARRLGRAPAQAVAFVGLNPIVLVYALGGKHNDLIMMAALMAGGLLILARREVLGGVTLAAAIAVKASAGLLAPLLVLAAPRRWRAVAGAAAGAIVLVDVSLLAFGPHLPDLAEQNRLVSSLSFPNLIGYAIGPGGADASIRSLMTILMIAGAALCAAVAWRTRRWETPAGWAALVAVVCTSWLMPWYVLWALPFAAISRSRVLRGAAVLMTVWVTFIASGLGTIVAHQRGIYPNHTAVGRANHQFELNLLRNPRTPRPASARAR
jgi:hypothetical protein